MDFLDKLIYTKYRDSEFTSYGIYKATLKRKENKIFYKLHLYPIYVEIIKYQIKTYGSPLCNGYECIVSDREKVRARDRARKFYKLKGGR